jgi:DNA-binding LacI/PurR family transcriptional regulator/serine phosphatase RsbU (regulator of sigma subunit)
MPKVIGLLIDLLEDEYQNQILVGMDAAAREHGVTLICFAGGTLEAEDRFAFGKHRNFIYDLASSDCIDGLVISAGTLGNAIGIERLAKYCERFSKQTLCTFAVPLPGIPCVTVDNATGMRAAVESLVSAGFERVALIRGPAENAEAQQRYQVYCDVLGQHGISVDESLVVFGDFTLPAGARATRQLLKLPDRPRAIVAANDSMALGALQEVLALGLRVPEDIAIVGFDDISEARFAAVPLSTVRQPIRRVGRTALELLMKRLAGEEVPLLTLLGTEFVPRQSSGSAGAPALPNDVVPGNTPGETLAGRRRYLAARLSELTSSWSALLDGFARAVEEASLDLLRSGVMSTAMLASERGEDSGVWQSALSTLRTECAAYAQHHPELAPLVADTAWDDLRVRISEVGEGAQARRVLGLQGQLRGMRRVGEGLLTSLGPDQIMRRIAEQLPELGLASCHIALFGEARLAAQAELVLAWRGHNSNPELVSRRFPSSSLLPDSEFCRSTRRSIVLEPLYFEEEQLGFALCEMGPLDGIVYETLREQTSSALQRASLLRRLLEQTKLRQHAEADQLRKEVEIAANIQTSILPRSFGIASLDISAIMLPAAQVGGDYYDVIAREGGCWIGIGDVAGHGLQTGLVMLMIQSMVAGITGFDPSAQPSTVVRALNAALYENVRQRLYQDEHATFTLLRYEGGGHITFAGGHEDIIVYRASEDSVELVPMVGPWVGARALVHGIVDSQLKLGPGDVMVLFTDGVTEARNPSFEMFGLDRLQQLVRELGREPVETIRDRLLAAVLGWAPVLEDDATLVVMRHSPQVVHGRSGPA